MYLSQLAKLIELDKPFQYLKEAKKIFAYHYSGSTYNSLLKQFWLIEKLYSGKYRGYRSCNTQYHDLKHILDTFLAVARLMDGYNLTRQEKFSVNIARNLLLAALLHDTGYIQKDWDKEGTGAKYTMIHVQRSCDFVLENAKIFKITTDDCLQINKYISCSGISVNLHANMFENELEKTAGAILGTGDLLGQMADRIYLEKLLFLYYEFREAGISGYNTEFDIIKKTLQFYDLTKRRFTEDFLDVQKYAGNHFEQRYTIGTNLYTEAIEDNIGYVRRIIEDDRTNFRHKLNRQTQKQAI